MNYNKEFLQYQTIFKGTLKRKYKSIVDVDVDREVFEQIMESGKDFPWQTLGVTVKWKVRVALENDETLGNLSSLGQDLFYSMFKIKGVVPWITLDTDYGN
jgi:hypothetical protein